MQQTDGTTQTQRKLPVVDRVIVHVEQMTVTNPGWKHFGLELGTLLRQRVTDVNTCVVQMSSPHLLCAGGVIHHLGEQIVDELRLVPVSYAKKGRKSQCSKLTQTQLTDVPSSSDGDGDQDTVDRDMDYRQKNGTSQCSKQTMLTDVEPSRPDSDRYEDMTDRDVDYEQKKKTSASIFRYFVYADDDRQSNMGVSVVREVQDLWRQRTENDSNIKLDDAGDVLLHGLNDILCGGSSYRQLVPSNMGVHSNWTVVIAACPEYTYWAVVIHCTWNIFMVEDVGWYQTNLSSRYYNSAQTAVDIKWSLLDNMGTALTDMTWDDVYRPVDVIKMVEKQLKGFAGFKGEHAGALTISVVTAWLVAGHCRRMVG